MPETGVIARAFELAGRGNCYRMDDIRRQLKLENYSNCEAHLHGRLIKSQLVSLMKH